MCQIMNFKDKKGKNKYNILEWWIKKSQYLKNPFYRKSNQNPNWVWLKSWLFDLTIGSYWILNHLVRHIFPFETIVYRPKSELKRIRYHKNTETLIKSSLYFSKKLSFFLPGFVQKTVLIGQELEWIG